jgi:hypothetical protein
MSGNINVIQIGGSRTVTGYFCDGEPEIEICQDGCPDVTFICGRADLEALAAMIDRLLKSTPTTPPSF